MESQKFKYITMKELDKKSVIYNTKLNELLTLKIENRITSAQFIKRKLLLNNITNNFISLSDLEEFAKMLNDYPKAFLQEKENAILNKVEEDELIFYSSELEDNLLLDIITSETENFSKKLISTALGELLFRCK